MHTRRDAMDSGKALAAIEADKHKRYDRYADELKAKVVPFVVDAYGRVADEAAAFVSDVMARHAVATDRAKSIGAYVQRVMAIISVAVQSGNQEVAAATTNAIRAEGLRRLRFGHAALPSSAAAATARAHAAPANAAAAAAAAAAAEAEAQPIATA